VHYIKPYSYRLRYKQNCVDFFLFIYPFECFKVVMLKDSALNLLVEGGSKFLCINITYVLRFI